MPVCGRTASPSHREALPPEFERTPSRAIVNRYPPTSRQRYQQFVEEARRASSDIVRNLFGKFEDQKRLTERLQARRNYWSWLRPGFRELGIVVAWSVLGLGLDMVWPLLSAYLIDRVILNRTLDVAVKAHWLLVGALSMVLILLVNSGLAWLRALKTQLVTSRLQVGLRKRLFCQVLRLPLGELQELRTGGLLSRLSTDVDHTAQLVQLALLGPALAGLRLLVTLTILFVLDYRIAASVTLAIPPILLIQALWARRMRRIWRSMAQDRQEIDARINEGLSGIRVVRGFRRERREELAQAFGLHTVMRKQMMATRTQRSVGIIWDLIVPITQLIIVCYGGYLVVQGQTTLGVVVAFQAYLWRLLEPILSIINSIAETQRGLAAMDRVFDLLDRPREHPHPTGANPAPDRVAEIRFEQVGFAYRPDILVLEGLNLTVAGGRVVALVGPSGSGKTTFTDLVARFYEPTRGRILLNGIDLRQYRLESYRSQLGIVSQEVFLFDGSVRENIGYGRLGASDAEIEAAARAANAHEFIAQLPEGYSTLVGERGVKLSGGQRQRLSIARALLADPKILILDEATSNLDTESEQLIQSALANLFAQRTTFIIAHRLSTVLHADVIVVLKGGRIVETGRHDELLVRGGVYAKMVERQLRVPHPSPTLADWPSE